MSCSPPRERDGGSRRQAAGAKLALRIRRPEHHVQGRACAEGEGPGRADQGTALQIRGAEKGVDPNDFSNGLIIDGPLLVAFRTGEVMVTVGKDHAVLPTPEYLLFLKRLKDGRYDPYRAASTRLLRSEKSPRHRIRCSAASKAGDGKSETFYAYRTVSRDCPIRPHALLRLAAADNAAMQTEPTKADPQTPRASVQPRLASHRALYGSSR